MTFSEDAEMEEAIAKEQALLKKDPFEKAKQKLRDKQENIYEDPKNIYVKITIPNTGVVGDNCVIKFSKEVPMAQIVVSQNISWKKRDKYDLKGKPEIVCRGFIIEEFKDVKEVKIPWEDIGQLHGAPYNFLEAGEYMVEVRGYSKEAYEETTSRRLIQVSKK